MREPQTICEYYEQDHDRLDALLRTYQQMKRSDFPKARESFKDFKFGLQRHIVWEEEILFPLWERRTGMSDTGPTAVMRAEHRQIGRQLEAIHAKVAEGSPETDGEEAALLNLLRSHNMKEERILYPAIDQATTPEEREAVFSKMERVPEERYRRCCAFQQTS